MDADADANADADADANAADANEYQQSGGNGDDDDPADEAALGGTRVTKVGHRTLIDREANLKQYALAKSCIELSDYTNHNQDELTDSRAWDYFKIVKLAPPATQKTLAEYDPKAAQII